MIERPTSIRIGALTYIIEWWDRKDSDLNKRFAEVDLNNSVIRIAQCYNPDRIAGAFVHEIMHALAYHFGEITEDGALKFDEEHLSNYGGYGLLMVWRDNPEVFDWYVQMVNQSIGHREGRAESLPLS